MPPEPSGEQRDGRVPGGGEQREQHPGRHHVAALTAENQHGEPGQRAGHGGQAAPAEAFAQQQARPDGDQDGTGAEGDDGADGEAGDLDRREVRTLEHRETDAGAEDPEQSSTPGFGLPGSPAGAQRERPGEQQQAAHAAPEGQGEGAEIADPEDQGRGRAGGAPGDSGDDEIQHAPPDGQRGSKRDGHMTSPEKDRVVGRSAPHAGSDEPLGDCPSPVFVRNGRPR